MDLQGFGVDIYLSQLVFAAVDIPAKLASVLTISGAGRRVAQGGSLGLAGVCILANIFVPTGGRRDGRTDGWTDRGRDRERWGGGDGGRGEGMKSEGVEGKGREDGGMER
ncbi:Solute carrier family 22 member 6-like protein [Aix galericulata]|nr:Solute carrier family 22 member 6-like protein [Aix galericulata]